METTDSEKNVGIGIMVYLFALTAVAVYFLITDCPTVDSTGKVSFRYAFTPDDLHLMLLAAAAGVAGSFIHAAQSLSTYLGNREFKSSWAVWYVLRPWIGGVLGLAIYFTFRAGLIAGASLVNPYGVMAIGFLGGCYSKTTTDKLQEVFETMFRTDEDKKRKDKLTAAEPPVIESVTPSQVPTNQNVLTIVGRNFQDGATILLNGREWSPTRENDSKLVLTLDAAHRPAAGTVVIKVRNPTGKEPNSQGHNVVFN